jgi:hypothetical protein
VAGTIEEAQMKTLLVAFGVIEQALDAARPVAPPRWSQETAMEWAREFEWPEQRRELSHARPEERRF